MTDPAFLSDVVTQWRPFGHRSSAGGQRPSSERRGQSGGESQRGIFL